MNRGVGDAYGLDATVDAESSPRHRTVSGLLITDVPVAASTATVGECRDRLQRQTYAEASVIAVVDGDRLVGLVAAEQLLRADPEAELATLITAGCGPVAADAPVEAAARLMLGQGQPAVAVADSGGRFLGLVPATRITALLLVEHDEDLARIGGYRSSANRARHAAEEPLGRRLWHRLPWLIVGLVGAMASAVLVGAFGEQLDEVVLLAFFVPAIVYIAGSVGTQTVTLLIRALAADVHLGMVVKRELLTGLLLGAAIAAMFYPFALIGWGSSDVALAVSLALLCSCAIATAVAMALPIALQRLGFDPAFGSGPLVTVLQDLLSIAIYFAIAVPLAT